jgi:hypothetical protein
VLLPATARAGIIATDRLPRGLGRRWRGSGAWQFCRNGGLSVRVQALKAVEYLFPVPDAWDGNGRGESRIPSGKGLDSRRRFSYKAREWHSGGVAKEKRRTRRR